jgi:hypothetical protein
LGGNTVLSRILNKNGSKRACFGNFGQLGQVSMNMKQLLQNSNLTSFLSFLLFFREYTGAFWDRVTDDIAPNYSKIVARPIDLTEIQEKAEQGQYSTDDEFLADVELLTKFVIFSCSFLKF